MRVAFVYRDWNDRSKTYKEEWVGSAWDMLRRYWEVQAQGYRIVSADEFLYMANSDLQYFQNEAEKRWKEHGWN